MWSAMGSARHLIPEAQAGKRARLSCTAAIIVPIARRCGRWLSSAPAREGISKPVTGLRSCRTTAIPDDINYLALVEAGAHGIQGGAGRNAISVGVD